jgi:hypothetical protein
MACSVKGCEQQLFAAGLCSKHYNRKRTTGTVKDGPRARLPLETRFWRYVRRRGPSECWPWIGESLVRGYGYISLGGRGSKKETSNRAAWILTHGPIPDGQVVRHNCHNRICCNPAHLMLGTRADNVADMWEREDGAPKGNARLSQADIAAIRGSKVSSRKLAPQYGVSDAHIRGIRRNRSWKS